MTETIATEVAKHTPGPWRFEMSHGWGRTVRALKDKYIAWHLKSDADAHLIAAAPELLEFVRLLERSLHYEIKKDQASGDDEGANLKKNTLRMACAVIAKAEGH